jgi:crossover junction endodeoxyribonuclease RuvC
MKPKAFLGIDPGQEGAVALISDEIPQVEDWPGDPNAAADALREWFGQYRIELVTLERVGAMPKQGVSSTFKLGQNVGAWQGILAALNLPYLMPTPREWQKGLVKKSDGPAPQDAVLGSGPTAVP